MSLFERIKYKRYDLQEKKKFPGDESGAYKRAKADIETKNLIKKAGGSGDIGFTAPKRKEKVLKRTTRAIKQGTPDPFDIDTSKAAKQTAKDFGTPTTSDIKKGKIPKGYTTPVSGFGKGITKGQANVKGLEAKAFKKTQPSDIKQTKGYKPYEKLSKDIKDFKKGTRNIASMNPSEMERAFGTSSTEGGAGASGSSKTQPQKSKAQKFTDKINRQNKNRAESGSGYSQTNKPKPGSEPTLFKKVKPKTSKIPVTPSEVVGSTPFDAKSGTKRKVDVTKNLTRKNRGFKEPLKIKKTRNVKTPKVELPNFLKNKTVNVSQKGYPKMPNSPQLATDINVRNAPREIRFAKTSQKVLSKTPKAIKPIARPALKLLAKAGTPGRIAAAGLGVAAISPAGRKVLGQLATGTGLTALFGRGKKEKQLKVGDGLKNVGKVRVTADSRGLKRNQADMAKIKATQKNFIDKYNKGRTFGKIKYNVNKQGTYDVIKPKKK